MGASWVAGSSWTGRLARARALLSDSTLGRWVKLDRVCPGAVALGGDGVGANQYRQPPGEFLLNLTSLRR
jgi:hypothetical protein